MFEVACTTDEFIYHIKLKGKIEAHNSHFLDEALQMACISGKRKIKIDCDNIETLSSKGIGILMSYLFYLEERKISLTLTHVPPRIFNMLQMLGLTAQIKILSK